MYAELSSRIPIKGSAFTYTYVTFGELPAFLVGCSLNLRYGATAASLGRGIASYLNGLLEKLGCTVPAVMQGVTVFGVEDCSIVAVLALFILTFIFTLGMSESNTFNLVFTALKLLTLVAIIVMAYINMNLQNFTPFTLEEEGGLKGTFLAASIIVFGYTGFDAVTTLSEDARNPARDIPASVKAILPICMLLYFLTASSLSGMARLEDLNAETAMADAFYSAGYERAGIVIYFCAVFGITTACFTSIVCQPKILQAQAADGLLPSVFSEVNARTNTPVKGAWISFAVMTIPAFFLDLE